MAPGPGEGLLAYLAGAQRGRQAGDSRPIRFDCPAATDCANDSAPSVSTEITAHSVQPFRRSPCDDAAEQIRRPPTESTTHPVSRPRAPLRVDQVACPRHRAGRRTDARKASSSLTMDSASALASCTDAPWMTTSAPSCGSGLSPFARRLGDHDDDGTGSGARISHGNARIPPGR